MLINKCLTKTILLIYLTFNFSNVIDSYITQITPFEANISLTASFLEKEHLNQQVKGIQFDILFNYQELIFSEAISLVEGGIFEYTKLDNGSLRCVLFNLNGETIKPSQLSNLATFNFIQFDNFFDNTSIYLNNVILAGQYGQDITNNYTTSSFEIDFLNLKPKSTYIYLPNSNYFFDEITLSFQLDKISQVNIEIYDIFNIKRKTLINKKMNIGKHSCIWDGYDDYKEKMPYGEYKVIMNTNSYKDSIKIVYKNIINSN